MRTSTSPLEDLSGHSRRRLSHSRRRNPQLTAWIVLWVSFGAFWALVIGASMGAKHYYDTATISKTATLSLEQGIVLFRDAVTSTLINAQDDLSLREGDQLMVGQGARASVALFDESRVTLYSGSELRLSELRETRFHNDLTSLVLRLEKGTARLDVAPLTSKNGQFLVATPHGAVTLGPGSFSVDVTEAQTRISARQGEALVQRNGDSANVKAEQKAIVSKEGLAGPLPAGDQLVLNGDFRQGFARWEFLDVDEPGRAVEPGKRMLLTERIAGQERMVFGFERISAKSTHNETGISQVINKDVSDYQSLELRADVRVDDQSLSGGGYMGYEYPVLVRVHYRDETGGQIDWSHGFFHKNPEARPTPNGEQVNQGQWFSYCVDLMEVKQKPVHIISIDVLGAGHSFTGMVANVTLTGK